MRMKSVFLATTAVALLTGTGAAQAGDLYVSVFGGANFQHDNSGSKTEQVFYSTSAQTLYSEDAETGYVLGASVGAHLDKWAQGLRAEIEVAHRRNDLGGGWHDMTYDTSSSTVYGSATGVLHGHVSNFSIMANAWYDVDMGWKVVPYVGGGFGWDRAKAELAASVTDVPNGSCCGFPDINTVYRTSQENTGFAWQLGAGFNYPVSANVDLGIGYRYFRGPSFDPLFIGKNETPVPIDNDNHSVQVNLTIGIN